MQATLKQCDASPDGAVGSATTGDAADGGDDAIITATYAKQESILQQIKASTLLGTWRNGKLQNPTALNGVGTCAHVHTFSKNVFDSSHVLFKAEDIMSDTFIAVMPERFASK